MIDESDLDVLGVSVLDSETGTPAKMRIKFSNQITYLFFKQLKIWYTYGT